MGTLNKMRLTMKTDRDLRKLMVRGSHNEILLDLDGDKQADIAFQDINSDGNIDRFAFDATGDGWFNLFIDDEDRNGIPDRIFVVKYGNDEELDKVEQLAAGQRAIGAHQQHAHRSAQYADQAAQQAAEKHVVGGVDAGIVAVAYL